MSVEDLLRKLSDAHGGDALPSPTGMKQLEFKLRTKEEAFGYMTPDIVYSSPLKRSLLTAGAVYPEKKIVVDARLREMNTRCGLTREELQVYVDTDIKADVDLSRLPQKGAWWSVREEESTECVQKRVQAMLTEIKRQVAKNKKIAIVSHHFVIKEMAKMRGVFPKQWGNARRFPVNFIPYYGVLAEGMSRKGAFLKVAPAKKEAASIVMVRHVHSKAQAANTLRNKLREYDPAKDGPTRLRKLADRVQKLG